MFRTASDGQKAAEIRVFQGENEDTRYDTLVGSIAIEGLADVDAGNQIVVRLDLDLNGILNVTAIERLTGLSRRLTIDNAMERFRKKQRTDAVDRLDAVFRTAADQPSLPSPAAPAPAEQEAPGFQAANALMARAERVAAGANAEDAAELRALITDLRAAVDSPLSPRRRRPHLGAEVEDLVFYLEDA